VCLIGDPSLSRSYSKCIKVWEHMRHWKWITRLLSDLVLRPTGLSRPQIIILDRRSVNKNQCKKWPYLRTDLRPRKWRHLCWLHNNSHIPCQILSSYIKGYGVSRGTQNFGYAGALPLGMGWQTPKTHLVVLGQIVWALAGSITKNRSAGPHLGTGGVYLTTPMRSFPWNWSV